MAGRHLRVILAVCAVGLLGSIAPAVWSQTPTTGAREVIVMRIGDTITPGFSIRTDSIVKKTANGKSFTAKTCGTSAYFLRGYVGDTAVIGKPAKNADSVTIIVPCLTPTSVGSVPLAALATMATACESTLVVNGYRADTGHWQSPAAFPSPACNDWKSRIAAQRARVKDSVTAANAAKPPT